MGIFGLDIEASILQQTGVLALGAGIVLFIVGIVWVTGRSV